MKEDAISTSRIRRNKVNTVLILNNDEAMQAFLQAALQDAGYNTLTTWSGYQALALLESQSLDVVLTEDYLPDLHIHDFLRRVARLPMRPRIVVTQATDPTTAEHERYVQLGVSMVIRKDDPIAVREAVSACLVSSSREEVC
jgi:CheY-like chemotaxis protein